MCSSASFQAAGQSLCYLRLEFRPSHPIMTFQILYIQLLSELTCTGQPGMLLAGRSGSRENIRTPTHISSYPCRLLQRGSWSVCSQLVRPCPLLRNVQGPVGRRITEWQTYSVLDAWDEYHDLGFIATMSRFPVLQIGCPAHPVSTAKTDRESPTFVD